MDIQKIKELALANGFKLKEQASGNMDLNAYVYGFANAIEQAAKSQAVPEGFVLIPLAVAKHAIDWAHCTESEYGVFNNEENESLVLLEKLLKTQEPAND